MKEQLLSDSQIKQRRIIAFVVFVIGIVAAFFLWNKNGDGAFVAGVLGAVSFFLSIRFQVKERNRQRELAEEEIRARLTDGAFVEEDLMPESEESTVNKRI